MGLLELGSGKALILGEAEVTAFRATPEGGVFIQRVFGDEGKGKLALVDSAYAYADEDEILPVKLAPGTYRIETARAKSDNVEAGLVRLRRDA